MDCRDAGGWFTTLVTAMVMGACGAQGSDHGDAAQGTSASTSGPTGTTTGGSLDPSMGEEGTQSQPDPSGASSESGDGESDTTATSDAGTSGTVGSTGATSGGEPACPEDGPPPGPYTMKFDVVTLQCGADQLECPADDDQCLCLPHWEALNVGPPHWMVTGVDSKKDLVWAAGNVQGVYVNDLNTDWMEGGQARADKLMEDSAEKFPCGIPKWFIVNEISASQWPNNPSYRDFVIDFAAAMDIEYDKSVVIAAPFDGPGNHSADWSALADHAYIAAEQYLSGKEINANGNSVSWCRAQYQSTVDAYGALGVPLSRLFLVEHFGQTTSDVSWGRAGASVAGWHNAIEARSQAAAQIGFPGFISYAWSWNLMHETDENRFAFMETYLQQSLP